MNRFRHSPLRTRIVRGVTLIEAAIALAVMSIGILALAGVQTTLRFNNDLSRQRSDAARIAAQDLERLRFFDALSAADSTIAYGWDSIASGVVADYSLPDATNNATFRIERVVASDDPASGPLSKTVAVTVSWQDRNGNDNNVTLNTVVAGIDPRVAALLSELPYWPGLGFARREGRALSIPVEAVPLADPGTSAFKPPGSSVAWVFDNTSGHIIGVCTGVASTQDQLKGKDLSSCPSVDGRLVSGTVRFHLAAFAAADQVAVAAVPAGPALPLDATSPLVFDGSPIAAINTSVDSPVCYATSPASISDASTLTAVNYYCLMKFGTDTTPGWGGKLNINPATSYASGETGWTIGAGSYQVCRYSAYPTLTPKPPNKDGTPDSRYDTVPNKDHPKTYCVVSDTQTNVLDTSKALMANLCKSNRVTENLTNQNFLVIGGGQTCPVDTRTVDASVGVLVNYNTRPHQK